MKIVLDSNILVAAIGRRSNYADIWKSFISQKYTLIISDEIVYEYEEILQLRSAKGASDIVIEIIMESSNVFYQQIYYSWNAIKQDPDDNKFFDIAVAGNADYLVTNDAHFNILKQLSFPKVTIITAEDFLKILEQS